MRQYRDEMQKIVYEVFGDELFEKDSIIENQKNELHDCYLALKSKDEKIESLKMCSSYFVWIVAKLSCR